MREEEEEEWFVTQGMVRELGLERRKDSRHHKDKDNHHRNHPKQIK